MDNRASRVLATPVRVDDYGTSYAIGDAAAATCYLVVGG